MSRCSMESDSADAMDGVALLEKEFIKQEIMDDDADDDDDEMMDTMLDDDDVVVVDVDKTAEFLFGKVSVEYNDILEKGVKTEWNDVSDSSSSVQPSCSTAGKSQTHVAFRGRRRKGLSLDLQRLMGQANIKFSEDEFDEAIKMCMEVIRKAPHVSEPFETLALVYERLEQSEKSLQCSLVAAHLKHSDADFWLQVADLCYEQNNIPQLLLCLEKASKLMPNDETVWLRRCQLLEATNDMKKALECYRHYLEILQADKGDEYMKLARNMIQKHYERKELDRVLETLLAMFGKHPELINDSDLNLLLEMYILKEIYDKPLVALMKHCGVFLYDEFGNVLTESTESSAQIFKNVTVTRCVLSNQIPIDLRAKLIICLIHLKFIVCAREIMQPVVHENPDDVGDLYLDIAEAYMSQGLHSDAKPLLEALFTSKKYNKAGVWLRYGSCLSALCELDNAIIAYEHVVEMAPSHYEARVSLSALYQQLGRQNEALRALLLSDPHVEIEDKTLDVRLAMLSCRLLHSQGRYEEFIESTKRIIFSFSKEIIDTRKHHSSLPHSRMWKSRFDALRHAANIPIDPSIKAVNASLHKSAVTTEDLWDLYVKLCHVLVDQKMFEVFEMVSIMALVCPLFLYDQTKALETEFICMCACIMNQNGHFAYGFMREHCVRNLKSNRAWNTFCQIITISQDQRHNRFCLRLAMKHPDNHALGILNGHNALIAGSYKHALGEYVAALRVAPNDPLLSLLVGVSFIHMASQRFATKRHMLTIQGCAFLNQYLELRGECQEAYFNLGRAMHQLGLYSSAIEYYHKALSFASAITGENEIFDLTKEIAYNLNLIYINSGSYELASQISQTYLLI